MSEVRDGAEGWDTYAPFYDWENARTQSRRDVGFWQRLALAQDGPVLELGCGTGRVAVPIVKAGATLVGVDLSAPMLARARTRLTRARLADRALLVRGDIRALPFRSRRGFGLVMAPYGILQSLTREPDLRATLASVARVLRRGGLFAMDLVPDLPRWNEYTRRTSLKGRRGAAATVTLDRVGATGSPAAAHDLRPGVRRAPRPHAHDPPLRADVPHAVGAADVPPARAGGLRRRSGAGRLSGRAVGRSRGRLGDTGKEEVDRGSRFAGRWCQPRPATRERRPATRDPRTATRDPRPANGDSRPATRERRI